MSDTGQRMCELYPELGLPKHGGPYSIIEPKLTHLEGRNTYHACMCFDSREQAEAFRDAHHPGGEVIADPYWPAELQRREENPYWKED